MPRLRPILGVTLLVMLAACGETSSGPTAIPLRAAISDAPAAAPAGSQVATVSAAPSSGPPPWRLAAFGDSIAMGGEGPGGASYVDRYADLITARTGHAVKISDFTDAGATAASLAEQLRSDAGTREAVSGADIITITVGGNDGDPFAAYPDGTCAPGGEAAACLAAYVPNLLTDYESILSTTVTLRGGKPTAIRTTSPDYDAFIGLQPTPDLPSFAPDFGLSFYRQVAAAETDAICALSERHGAACADFFHAFNGDDGSTAAGPLLADDHLHPSAAGQQKIADLLMDLGLSPLE